MDEQGNPLERDHSLSVVLPGGMEKNATVHGSKPVMDLLVTLCASYHLNPTDYTVEVLSPDKNNISFKPNSPIGLLEAEKIVLKPKGVEEKIRRPYMPEASVRLLINYNKSHKAVVRVNPRVPLELLLPVVCDKCEFNVETTILLRDSQSEEPLDLTKTLNDHGLREVFAKDTAAKETNDHQHQPKTPETAVTPTELISPPPLQEKKQKDSTGFLSLFRRRKKKAEMEEAGSAPASPGRNKHAEGSMNAPGVASSNTLPTDMPKKRRAPQPPMGASQSVPNNLGICHVGGSQRYAESTIRSTKRRAPPPPCANTHQADTGVKGTVDSLNTVEELGDSDESDSVNLSLPSSSSPHPSHPCSSSSFSRPSSSFSRPSFTHLHEVADPYLPSFRGKDLTDARCALAKILTSSISKVTQVKRLRNSATFPKSAFTSMTQRTSDNGAFRAELESVLQANLPTEREWEDPAGKKGMTTFKVVPSTKHVQELTPSEKTLEDNPESEASPEVGTNPIETEEDPCAPDRSETETPLHSPEPSSQEIQVSDRPASLPPPHDLDNQDSPEPPLSPPQDLDNQDGPDSPLLPPQDLDNQDSPDSPPSPPQDLDNQDGPNSTLSPPQDLDNQENPGSSLSEVGDTDEKQKEEDKPEVTSEVTPAAPSDCSDGELTSDGQINSEDHTERPSPFGQSLSTDVDPCGSYTDEKEVEEEAVQEEEEEEDCFPPPPPPVFFKEVTEEEREHTTASQPTSPTSNGQTNEFSEGHENKAMPDQSAAAPKPQSAAPSRFAEAVALAVQRSLQRRGKGLDPEVPSGPRSSLPSPPRTTYQYGA